MRECVYFFPKNLWRIFLIFVFSSCGPKPIPYIKLNTPGTEGILLNDVELYYSHEKIPKNFKIIEHITETARHPDCKEAAIYALRKMQKRAKDMGADAIVNIKPVEAEQVLNKKEKKKKLSEGFVCNRSKSFEEGSDLTYKIWEISFEGDAGSIIESVNEETLE